jgi:tetratricopeptide (TPR) repeat protein
MTEGKEREAVALQKASIAINPDLPHVWGNLGSAETYFGHDETVFQSARRSFALFGNLKTASQLAGYAVAAGLLGSKTIMSDLLGNYREAIAAEKKMRLMASYAGSGLGSQVAMRDDLILGHDVPLPPYRLAALRAADAQTLQDFSSGRITLNAPPLAAYDFAAAEGDWLAARNAIETDLKYPAMKAPALAPLIPVWFRPRLALADMKSGDIVAAQLLIDKTPRDCYLCVRVRGQIAAAQKRWRQADRWFAAAVHQVPSLPFAEHDWGVALMAKGDRTGAIAKFESAHKKGPHFADPLEMWGEVLMLQNRSDLALAKFAEAAQVAPNWSRLHLKWGEALTYAGNKAAAKKQFALAAQLFMTPSEKTELQRFATR